MEDSAPNTTFDAAAGAPGLRERLAQIPGVLQNHFGTRVSDRSVALSIGTSSQNWRGYTMEEGTRMPPASVIQGIADRYPMLSLRWLLLGEGAPIQGWAAGKSEDIGATVMRLAAERGVAFSHLKTETVNEDGVDYIVFEAAGRARA